MHISTSGRQSTARSREYMLIEKRRRECKWIIQTLLYGSVRYTIAFDEELLLLTAATKTIEKYYIGCAESGQLPSQYKAFMLFWGCVHKPHRSRASRRLHVVRNPAMVEYWTNIVMVHWMMRFTCPNLIAKTGTIPFRNHCLCVLYAMRSGGLYWGPGKRCIIPNNQDLTDQLPSLQALPKFSIDNVSLASSMVVRGRQQLTDALKAYGDDVPYDGFVKAMRITPREVSEVESSPPHPPSVHTHGVRDE